MPKYLKRPQLQFQSPHDPKAAPKPLVIPDDVEEGVDPLEVSKTKRKEHMHYLQRLGRRMTELSREKLNSLELPDVLMQAFIEYQRISTNEAKRRQLQLIGKLMRLTDPAPIEVAFERWSGKDAYGVQLMHRCEQWREQLLADDQALVELASEIEIEDFQLWRQTIRNARREKLLNKPPKSYREIFQLLKVAFETADHRQGLNPNTVDAEQPPLEGFEGDET